FMNASGNAVGPLVRFYARPLSDVLVVYDDIDIPFGKIRLRPCGGSGGHKGMKSIIANLGSDEFPRLRLGVRGNVPAGDLSDYVLEPFTTEEKAALEEVIEEACCAIKAVLAGSFEKAMSRFN
ncbi:MAG: peptidyl-tRNA hydrolase, partial [Candidatus Hydrogenedentota bacterium]